MTGDGDPLEPGTVLATRTIEDVDAEAMKLVTAVVRDPNPMHYDPEYATDQGFPGRVNQGPINAAYAAQAALLVADSPADLRTFDVRYDGFVFEGETVEATATFEGARDADGPLVDLSLELVNQDGDVVLTGTATLRTSPEDIVRSGSER
ncbi:MaoC family dehydratase [Haloarchaeobius sp. HRN-SO-5]|uniref:MaoC family dehydratase n=1 Tax=Haloarchaeobius sp. HRN-SO-5 TaxID=3446118 RepID=UPI003EB764E0